MAGKSQGIEHWIAQARTQRDVVKAKAQIAAHAEHWKEIWIKDAARRDEAWDQLSPVVDWWLERLREPDSEAAEEACLSLVDLLYHDLCKAAHQRLGPDDRLRGQGVGTQVLVHEMFPRIKSFLLEKKPQKWDDLVRVATKPILDNTLIDLVRKLVTGRGAAPRPQMGALPDSHLLGPKGETPSSEVAAEEERSAVAAAIADLPEKERQAIVMIYIRGMSQAEAAKELDVDRKTIQRWTTRAMASLRERLGAV